MWTGSFGPVRDVVPGPTAIGGSHSASRFSRYQPEPSALRPRLPPFSLPSPSGSPMRARLRPPGVRRCRADLGGSYMHRTCRSLRAVTHFAATVLAWQLVLPVVQPSVAVAQG